MSGLPFEVEIGDMRKVPKGKLPYMRDGGAVVADRAFIQRHLERNYGVDFDEGLSAEQRAAGWALTKMCEEHLYWAMVDARWSIDANLDKGPRQFFAAAPAPLRRFIVAKVRRDMKRTLHGQGFGRQHGQRSSNSPSAIWTPSPGSWGKRIICLVGRRMRLMLRSMPPCCP